MKLIAVLIILEKKTKIRCWKSAFLISWIPSENKNIHHFLQNKKNYAKKIDLSVSPFDFLLRKPPVFSPCWVHRCKKPIKKLNTFMKKFKKYSNFPSMTLLDVRMCKIHVLMFMVKLKKWLRSEIKLFHSCFYDMIVHWIIAERILSQKSRAKISAVSNFAPPPPKKIDLSFSLQEKNHYYYILIVNASERHWIRLK